MQRTLILVPMLLLLTATASAAARLPLQASGSATLSATAFGGVSGAVTLPRAKATPVDIAVILPRK